jgi:PEGA domain
MKTILTLSINVVLLCHAVTLQRTNSSGNQTADQSNAPKTSTEQMSPATELQGWQLDAAQTKISNIRPDVQQVTLARDRQVVATAYPAIERKLVARGFTDDEAKTITVLSWQQIRLGPDPDSSTKVDHNSPLSKDDLFQFATVKFGGLVILSSPKGAAVWVDGKQLDGKTNLRLLAPVQRHRIALSLSGYEDESGEVEVKPATLLTFTRHLRKRGAKQK